MSNSDHADTVLVVDLDPNLTPYQVGHWNLAMKHFGRIRHLDHLDLKVDRGEGLVGFFDRIQSHLQQNAVCGIVVAVPYYLTDGRIKQVEAAAQSWRDCTGVKVKVERVAEEGWSEKE